MACTYNVKCICWSASYTYIQFAALSRAPHSHLVQKMPSHCSLLPEHCVFVVCLFACVCVWVCVAHCALQRNFHIQIELLANKSRWFSFAYYEAMMYNNILPYYYDSRAFHQCGVNHPVISPFFFLRSCDSSPISTLCTRWQTSAASMHCILHNRGDSGDGWVFSIFYTRKISPIEAVHTQPLRFMRLWENAALWHVET